MLINELNNDYSPRNETKINEINDVLKFAKKLLFIREEIIATFKKGIFPYIDGFQVKKETDEETDEESTSENEIIDTTIIPELESEESSSK